MQVNEVDDAWAGHADAREKVADLNAGRESALSYVRKLPGHEAETEKAFRTGAYFLPMVARTREAFGGLVFGKTPARTVPDQLQAYLSDVTQDGQDIDRFAEQAFDSILLTGTVGVLVDYPEAPAGMTRAVAEADGVRPVLKLYDANTILAARFRKVGKVWKLAHVRVLESVQEDVDGDEWAQKGVPQVRVLDLDDAGLYRQRVFRSHNGGWQLFGDVIEPKRANKRLDAIPMFFSNPRDAEPKAVRPPLADLAEINIAHLNNSAALEWALLWTANPTPVFIGLTEDSGTIKLGSSEGISLDVGGDAKFLEFTGAGLSELRNALDAKRKDAAVMGARMLLESARQVIAAETARIERAGETSVVAGIANALSDCLTKALRFMAEWAGIGGEVEYWLNTDLNPAGLSAQELTALISAWTSGAISKRELFAKLQQHEVVDPAKSYDDHEEEVAEDSLSRTSEGEDETDDTEEPELEPEST